MKDQQKRLVLKVYKKSPPFVVIVGEESVYETNCPYYCSKQQHLSVETQPRKINTYLLSIILPVEGKNNNIFYVNSSAAGLMLIKYATDMITLFSGLTL